MPGIIGGEVWLALRSDRYAGTGSILDPYDASGPTLFAELLNSFQPNTLIHLGPGIFQTFGYAPNSQNVKWQPSSGQRIIGAGMFATTLKVVNATDPHNLTTAIQRDPSQNVNGDNYL